MDTTTPVKQIFAKPIEAKIVRINPQTWNNAISLRLELIGCGEAKTTTPYPTTVTAVVGYNTAYLNIIQIISDFINIYI